MTKHLSDRAKKWAIIAIPICVLVLVAGGYYGYTWYQQYQQTRVSLNQEAKDQAASYYFSGDQDIAARYIELMNANKTADAQQLFVDKVHSESDTQKKVDLYTQNVNLALSLKKMDAALEAAKRMVEIRASHDTYAQLANVYIARGEPEEQVVTLQKALDTLGSASVANKDDLTKLYQSQLEAAKAYIDIRSRYAQ